MCNRFWLILINCAGALGYAFILPYAFLGVLIGGVGFLLTPEAIILAVLGIAVFAGFLGICIMIWASFKKAAPFRHTVKMLTVGLMPPALLLIGVIEDASRNSHEGNPASLSEVGQPSDDILHSLYPYLLILPVHLLNLLYFRKIGTLLSGCDRVHEMKNDNDNL